MKITLRPLPLWWRAFRMVPLLLAGARMFLPVVVAKLLEIEMVHVYCVHRKRRLYWRQWRVRLATEWAALSMEREWVQINHAERLLGWVQYGCIVWVTVVLINLLGR